MSRPETAQITPNDAFRPSMAGDPRFPRGAQFRQPSGDGSATGPPGEASPADGAVEMPEGAAVPMGGKQHRKGGNNAQPARSAKSEELKIEELLRPAPETTPP